MRTRGAHPRRGVEIVCLDEGLRRRLACRIEADDAVDRRRQVGGVVLANRDQSLMPVVEDEIGMPDVLRRRNRDGWLPGILPVETLVFEVREPDGALAHQGGTAAVLVHAAAHVELRWCDVRDAAVSAAPDDDIPAGLGGPLLDPIDVIAVELDLAESNDAGHDRVSRDGRAPGAIGAGLPPGRRGSSHPRQGYPTR